MSKEQVREVNPLDIINKWMALINLVDDQAIAIKKALNGANVDPVLGATDQIKKDMPAMVKFIEQYTRDHEELTRLRQQLNPKQKPAPVPAPNRAERRAAAKLAKKVAEETSKNKPPPKK